MAAGTHWEKDFEKALADLIATTDARSRLLVDKLADDYAYYRKHQKRARSGLLTSQTVAAIAAAAVPICIIFDVNKAAGIVSGVATVFGLLPLVFGWQDDWVRYASSAEAIQSTLLRYMLRLPPDYDEKADPVTALAALMGERERIVNDELRQWRDFRKTVDAALVQQIATARAAVTQRKEIAEPAKTD